MSSIGGVGASGTNPLQQAMQKLFAKSDANTDGKLDTSEIDSLLETIKGGSDGSDRGLTAQGIVSAFDTDGDGAVSGSEFDAGFKKLADSMQGSMIAMQESSGGQKAHHAHGGHHGPKPPEASNDDDDDDSTDDDLLKLLEATSTDTATTAGSDGTDTAGTASGLAQSLLSQLEKYAKSQTFQNHQAPLAGGVSLSA